MGQPRDGHGLVLSAKIGKRGLVVLSFCFFKCLCTVVYQTDIKVIKLWFPTRIRPESLTNVLLYYYLVPWVSK